MKQERSYGCMDYRQEMVLLGLKGKLEREGLTEDEKRDIREQIQRLESVMDMD